MTDFLVRCADGKQAPAAVICKHLGQAKQYYFLPDDGQGIYCCPHCYANYFPPIPPLEVISMVCIHCVRKMVKNKERLEEQQ